MPTATLWFLISASLGLSIVVYSLVRRGSRQYPPGPPSLPIVGHLVAVPATNQHVVFHEWSKKYGKIIHLSVFGQHVVVLGDVKTCVELLDKRGSIYSDRPLLTVSLLLNSGDLPLMPYGDRFRKHRKFIHSNFTRDACARFLDGQRQNASIFAINLMKYQDVLCEDSLAIFASSTITKVMSGHLIVSSEDEWVKIMKEHAAILHNAIGVAGSLLEFVPLIRYLPSWVPGTELPTLLRSKSWVFPRIYDKSYEQAQQQLDDKVPSTSILAQELRKLATEGMLNDECIHDLKRMAGAALRAANDTTASTLHTFIYIMTVHPDIQKRAQEEIDRVLGADRIPQFGDDLPYISVLIQELFRWNPVIPLGVAHKSTEDDVYGEYFIPKGATIITNLYGMSRDENVYHDPTRFDPTRFFPSPEGRGEPLFGAAFGFGRRICPGRHFAYDAVWIAVVTCLATLTFSKQVDEAGNEIIPDPEFSTGVFSAPKSFPFNVSTRSSKTLKLLQLATEKPTL